MELKRSRQIFLYKYYSLSCELIYNRNALSLDARRRISFKFIILLGQLVKVEAKEIMRL